MDKPFYLSDAYWDKLGPSNQALYLKVRPMPTPIYTVDIGLARIEWFLSEQESSMADMGGKLELVPDFQRGHVWSDEQRVRFVESFIRGAAPKLIQFNCPGWQTSSDSGDIPHHTFQCIDGLQRLTSLRKFIAGDVLVFDGMTAADLKGSPFDPARMHFPVAVYEFTWKADLLRYYLDHNGSGTPHSKEELDRVQKLYEEALVAKFAQ